MNNAQGGYKIIDFKGIDLINEETELNESQREIFKQIEATYKSKAFLISNFLIDNVEQNAVFAEIFYNDDSYKLKLYDYNISITNNVIYSKKEIKEDRYLCDMKCYRIIPTSPAYPDSDKIIITGLGIIINPILNIHFTKVLSKKTPSVLDFFDEWQYATKNNCNCSIEFIGNVNNESVICFMKTPDKASFSSGALILTGVLFVYNITQGTSQDINVTNLNIRTYTEINSTKI